MGRLNIVNMPGTSAWTLKSKDARYIAEKVLGPAHVRLEYWPRRLAGTAWVRHRDRHPGRSSGYWYPKDMAFQLRGYSLISPPEGAVAVVFVDHRENYESATFVVLHELAHLLVDEDDDDEIHADLIASIKMGELGYGEGIREAITPGLFLLSSSARHQPHSR